MAQLKNRGAMRSLDEGYRRGTDSRVLTGHYSHQDAEREALLPRQRGIMACGLELTLRSERTYNLPSISAG